MEVDPNSTSNGVGMKCDANAMRRLHEAIEHTISQPAFSAVDYKRVAKTSPENVLQKNQCQRHASPREPMHIGHLAYLSQSTGGELIMEHFLRESNL